MMTIKTDICVDVPIEKAWQEMSRIDDVHLYVDMIADSYCVTEHNRGLATVRECVMTDKSIVREKFTEWVECKSFTYEVVGEAIRGIETAQNRWTFESVGNKTLIRSRATFTLKWGLFGRLLEPIVWLGFKFSMRDIAASIKYFVVIGKAFEGKASKLPRAQSIC